MGRSVQKRVPWTYWCQDSQGRLWFWTHTLQRVLCKYLPLAYTFECSILLHLKHDNMIQLNIEAFYEVNTGLLIWMSSEVFDPSDWSSHFTTWPALNYSLFSLARFVFLIKWIIINAICYALYNLPSSSSTVHLEFLEIYYTLINIGPWNSFLFKSLTFMSWLDFPGGKN